MIIAQAVAALCVEVGMDHNGSQHVQAQHLCSDAGLCSLEQASRGHKQCYIISNQEIRKQSGCAGGAGDLKWSWRVVAGHNAAYDAFPNQARCFQHPVFETP